MNIINYDAWLGYVGFPMNLWTFATCSGVDWQGSGTGIDPTRFG